MLASSIALFSNSSKADHPFYGFFNIHPLNQLSRSDAREYLLALAQAKGDLTQAKKDGKLAANLRKRHAQARVNAIYDLTGGNHRLLAMLSIFLSADGLEELVDPFIQMADRELTPYYQQRLDRLSPQQNKLLQTIAASHGMALNGRSLKGSPLSVNEIANLTFLPPSTVSRQLYDLLAGGYVHRTQEGRESFYELQEPLLRLVLDLKEGRGQPLSIIVSLLKDWYNAQELQQLEKIAPEHARYYYQAAYRATLEDMQYAKADSRADSKTALEMPTTALEMQVDIQSRMQGSQTQGEELLFDEGWKLIQEGDYTAALEKFEQLLQKLEQLLPGDSPELQEQVARALFNKGVTLGELERYEEELSAYDQVIDRFSESDRIGLQEPVDWALFNKGVTLGKLGRYEEALSAYDQVIERFSENDRIELQEQVVAALNNKGAVLDSLGKYSESLAVLNNALQIQPDFPYALAGTVLALIHLRQEDKALESLSNMLGKVPISHGIRADLASGLIAALLQDEKRLKHVIEIYQPDQESLVAGLTRWIQSQLPLSKSEAEKLKDAYQTLESAFSSITEAEPVLQILQAARLDAMGDRKALLSLPIELRRLVERAKEESIGKQGKNQKGRDQKSRN